MSSIIAAVLPVFLIILLGMAAEKLELVPHECGRQLGLFVVNICMPCLLFYIMSRMTAEQFVQGRWWLCVIGVQVGIMAVVYGIERLRHVPMGPSVVTALSASFNNAAFIGLPVVMNLLPGNEEALAITGLCIISTNSVVVVGQASLEAWNKSLGPDGKPMPKAPSRDTKEPLRSAVWRKIRLYLLSNPVLLATIAGLVVAATGLKVWQPVNRALSLIGYLAPGCMLFSLGYGLREKLAHAVLTIRNGGGWGFFWHQLFIHITKLCLLPALTWAALAFCGYSGLWLAVAVIMSAPGSAVVTSVFAEIYRANADEAAVTITVSTILCIVSLTAFIWLMGRYGYLPQ